MKQIKQEFTLKGYTHTLMERNGRCAIYVVKDKVSSRHHYEVLHVLKHRVSRDINGRVLWQEGDEYLPSQSDWGEQVWTIVNLQDALSKYETETSRLLTKAKMEIA